MVLLSNADTRRHNERRKHAAGNFRYRWLAP